MVLDLDDFKQINDRHGHEVGDRVLERVGLALRELEGVLTSRFGGEEFVLLFRHATAEEAIARCQSLRVQLAASEVEGIHITVSMGIAHWQGSGTLTACSAVRMTLSIGPSGKEKSGLSGCLMQESVQE